MAMLRDLGRNLFLMIREFVRSAISGRQAMYLLAIGRLLARRGHSRNRKGRRITH